MKIQSFSDEHVEVFRRFGIDVVYLFGSYADGTETPLSDADFGIVLSDPSCLKDDSSRVYGDMYSILCEVLPKSYLMRRKELGGHEFDIVFLQRSNPRMRYLAAMNGRVIYASSAKATADFRERSMLEYYDYRHFESISNEAFIANPARV